MDAHPAVPLTFEVVTTYADRHWESHAKRCVESFGRYWEGVRLQTYTDSALEAESTWLSQFKRRHAGLPTSNYRFDVVRFSHKIAALELAFSKCRTDYLIWMDADCVTHDLVDAQWLAEMAQGADFAYLKRSKKYSEMGFFFLRMNEVGQELLGQMVDMYANDFIFDLKEWHDSWAFDVVRKRMEEEGGCTFASLSGDAEATGHPLVNGPLGSRLDHLKGGRKSEGRSRKSDLTTVRTEPYWNG